MSVPPTRPSSTPPSKGRPDEADKKEGKEFKLPARKQKPEGKEEEAKKKGLFDIAAEEITTQSKQQQTAQEMEAKAAKVTEISGAQAAAQVSQVSQLIQRMVETMMIGTLNAKDFASLELKKGAEVPEAFAGSHLTVSYQANGIVIKFDNFMTAQQQNNAITLVEKNKEQLQDMVQALNTKNIQVAELTIGNHTVSLPRVEPLPPPFQPQAATQAETQQQRERGGGEREGKEGGGGGRGKSR